MALASHCYCNGNALVSVKGNRKCHTVFRDGISSFCYSFTQCDEIFAIAGDECSERLAWHKQASKGDMAMAVKFQLNGKQVSADVEPDTPLLWVIRDTFGLTGTKFGCGIAQCGACTVHLNGFAMRSCVTPISQVEGGMVTTIEGLEGKEARAIQDAWVGIDVPQCGFCQSGQVMSATALLKETPNPTDDDINQAMAGNICRCATYVRIRKAIHNAADTLEG